MFFPVKKYRIVGKSMEPTLKHGDSVLACHIAYKLSRPKKDHIVVVTHPTKGIPIIKRITKAKDSKFFLEGDNAKKSTDSNDFGWIERNRILGKVFYTLS